MPQLPSDKPHYNLDEDWPSLKTSADTKRVFGKIIKNTHLNTARMISERVNNIYPESIRQLQNTIEDFSKRNTEMLQQTISPAKMLAESIKPPSLFEEQIKNIERLTEPLRVDFKIPEPPTRDIPLRYDSMLEEESFDVENLIDPQKPYEYYSETSSLVINMWTVGAINFDSKEGGSNIATLIKILINILDERGKDDGKYISVFVTAAEILEKAREEGIEDADMNWLKHTRSNLINYKIPKSLQHAIKISPYDKKKKGYYFKIKN